VTGPNDLEARYAQLLEERQQMQHTIEILRKQNEELRLKRKARWDEQKEEREREAKRRVLDVLRELDIQVTEEQAGQAYEMLQKAILKEDSEPEFS
jgi:hypothetical protein